MQAEPDRDIARELRDCNCSDFLTRFKAQIAVWESEPLDSRLIPQLLESAVWLFNNSCDISCITMLNGVEAMERGLARRMRNFDLLRAMAFYALDMKEQSLSHLHREIEDHDSAAAREFLRDYFQCGVKADVRQWCAGPRRPLRSADDRGSAGGCRRGRDAEILTPPSRTVFRAIIHRGPCARKTSGRIRAACHGCIEGR